MWSMTIYNIYENALPLNTSNFKFGTGCPPVQPDARVTMLNGFEMIKHLLFTVLKLDLVVHCGLNFGPVIIFIV